MAKRSGSGAKSESLTIRLDPKTRFILEFISRARGQPLTTVVERAIVEAADQVTVLDHTRDGGQRERTWRDVWSTIEGIRALRMARYKELYPGFEEERRLQFCQEHWPFFYTNRSRSFYSDYVDILWPRIDEFMRIHESSKQSDYFAAGKAMQDALRNASIPPPRWPPEEEEELSF